MYVCLILQSIMLAVYYMLLKFSVVLDIVVDNSLNPYSWLLRHCAFPASKSLWALNLPSSLSPHIH